MDNRKHWNYVPYYRGKVVEDYLKVLLPKKDYDAWTITDKYEVVQCVGSIESDDRWNYHNNYDNSENVLHVKFPGQDKVQKWFSLNKEDVLKVQRECITSYKAELQGEIERLDDLLINTQTMNNNNKEGEQPKPEMSRTERFLKGIILGAKKAKEPDYPDPQTPEQWRQLLKDNGVEIKPLPKPSGFDPWYNLLESIGYVTSDKSPGPTIDKTCGEELYRENLNKNTHTNKPSEPKPHAYTPFNWGNGEEIGKVNKNATPLDVIIDDYREKCCGDPANCEMKDESCYEKKDPPFIRSGYAQTAPFNCPEGVLTTGSVTPIKKDPTERWVETPDYGFVKFRITHVYESSGYGTQYKGKIRLPKDLFTGKGKKWKRCEYFYSPEEVFIPMSELPDITNI